MSKTNGNNQGGSSKKITITIIVSGTATDVTVNENAPTKTLVTKALEQTDNTGRPPSDWQLKDKDGNVLDLDKKIKEYNFAEGITLFLSLRAGQGG